MPILDALERNRGELRRQESDALLALTEAYRGLSTRLDTNIRALNTDIELLHERGQLRVNKVRQLATYGSLLNQVQDELDRYGVIADNQMRRSASQAITISTDHAQRLTREYFTINNATLQAFNTVWDRLPAESIETLLGFLREDSELHTSLINQLGTNGTQYFNQQIIEGVGLGYNPRKIAHTITNALGAPLTWSMTTVRTAQLWTYRESTRLNYINNSNVVDGWIWFAQLDGRVCLSCANQHGRQYPLTSVLNDHHNGRCAQLPSIPEFPVQVDRGETWFNNLAENEQRSRMGNAMYEAYQNNEFRFEDLSKTYESNVYGEMLQQNSLRGMIGDDRAREYYQ